MRTVTKEAGDILKRAGHDPGADGQFPGLVEGLKDLAEELTKLTPRLVWSPEPPRTPGLYFIRKPKMGVSTIERFDDERIALYSGFPKKNTSHPTEFAGPIPEPAEPEGGE